MRPVDVWLDPFPSLREGCRAKRGGEGLALGPMLGHLWAMPRFPRRSYSTRLSRHLRRRMTEPELRLWASLRHDLPRKFRRQEPLGPYICDFVCYSHRLVVEVDGIQHGDNPHDEERDRALRRMGFRVERVWNGDVMTDLDGVIEQITAALTGRRSVHRKELDAEQGFPTP